MKKKIITMVAIVTIVVMCCVIFVGCMPKKPEKAAKILKDKGYVVKISYDPGYGTVVLAYIEDYLEEVEDYCYIYFFEDENDSDEFYKEMKYQAIEDEDSESIEDEDSESIEVLIKKSGKVVFLGTKKAYKALSSI